MKRIRNVILCAILLTLAACSPQAIISFKSSEKVPEGHIAYVDYFLPKSVLKIKVPIVKSNFEPGLYQQLKSQNEKKIIDELSKLYGWKNEKDTLTTFGLGKKIQFIPLTEPDPNKHNTLAFKNKKVLTQSSKLNLTKDGIIASGEFAQENKTFEYVTKSVELGASIISKFYTLGDELPEDFTNIDNPSKSYSRILHLMKELKDLVEGRNDMIVQNANGVSKDVIEYRMKYIDKRLGEIKAEIMGQNKKTTYWLSLLYEPNKNKEEIDLIKIAKDKGIIVPNGIAVLNGVIDTTISKSEKDILSLSIVANQISLNVKETNQYKTASVSSSFMRYNIPAKYSLQLLLDGKPLKSFKNSEDKKGTDIYTMYFPQKGIEGVLPTDFKESSIVYYEDIGAIKSISFSKEATVNTSAVQAIYAAADSVISLKDARQAYLDDKNSDDEDDDTEETEETVIRIIFDGDLPTNE